MEDIRKRIDRVAKKGNDGQVEFKELMEEFIRQERFSVFVDTLYIHYGYEGRTDDFEELRTKGWKQVLFWTNTELTERLKKLYDKKEVYRIGLDIFRNNENVPLGSILTRDEFVDLSKKFDTTQQRFQEGILNKITILTAVKNNGETISFGIGETDWNVSGPGAYQKELLRLYGSAIDYLLS